MPAPADPAQRPASDPAVPGLVAGRHTIVAQATAPGRAGVAVLRVSGPRLQSFAQALTGCQPQPRHAHFVTFRDQAGEALDQGLLLWFPAPASYTGEDVLELHTHGGDVLPRRVLQACLAAGARLAEPGEFTRRAFANGKLDLMQAEAVADLIDATSVAAARGALRSLTGAFSQRIEQLQQALTLVRVQLEGAIDFPEEDLPVSPLDRARVSLQPVLAGLRDLVEEGLRGQALKAGRQVVLFGAPNVGKSSLLNRLAGEDLAIVSPEAGTTRDTVRSHLELAGLRLELVDTAGVRSDAGTIEQLGIARAHQAARQADLVIWLRAFDGADDPAGLGDADGQGALQPPGDVPCLQVWNKVDLATAQQRAAREREPGVVCVSAQTGAGLDQLERILLERLGWSAGAEPGFMARARHLDALHLAAAHIEAAQLAPAEELVTEELRLAQRALDPVLGRFVADDLLGEIFARFCIGK